jgi:hypothetical protein
MTIRSASAVFAALVAASIAMPALAKSVQHRGDTGNARSERHYQAPASVRAGRDAYGSASAHGGGGVSPYDPAANGGGSLGYNQKLLVY